MSRQDPGAATGQPIREPERCACGHLEAFHVLRADHTRGKCHGFCACERFEAAS